MKKQLKTLGATLLIIPLLCVGVVSANEDMTTTDAPETKKTTMQERVQARRDASKERLTAAQVNIVKNRCKETDAIITNVQKRVNSFQTDRADRYTKLVDKLGDFSARLKAADVDTTKYDSQVIALDVLAQEFHDEVEELKLAVDDLQAMDCTTDPEGFVATVKAAVELRKEVIVTGREFRKQLKETVKPTLAAIKADLQATKKPQGEQ